MMNDLIAKGARFQVTTDAAQKNAKSKQLDEFPKSLLVAGVFFQKLTVCFPRTITIKKTSTPTKAQHMKTSGTFALSLLLLSLLAGCQSPQTPENEGNKENGKNATQGSVEDVVTKIVTGSTNGSEQPDGWGTFTPESSGCSIAWPSEFASELETLDTSIELDEGDLTFAFGSTERDEEHQRLYTGESISNLIEAGARVGDTSLVSRSKQDGQTFVRMFGNQGEIYTQLGRVYTRKDRFWFIAATVKKGKESDPRVQYFFENFKLTK